MWVKLFYRHLHTSVRRRPLQPVLSVFILALSVVITFTALNVFYWLNEEAEARHGAQYGNAALTITLNSSSDSRFLQTEDVYAALGDGVNAAGCYELPMYLEDGALAFAVAVDFTRIETVFPLSFTAYGKVTADAVNDTAFISASFAKKYALAVGDTFTAELLGYEKSYTVQAISQNAFMDSFSVMVSVYGVVRLIATDAPFIAALGENFAVYSSLYIACDSQNAAAYAEVLRAFPSFADKTVSVVTEVQETTFYAATIAPFIYILVFLISFLAAAVIFCCFYILSSQRAQENALFVLSGAPPKTLLLLQCSELFFYWLAGGILGAGVTAAIATPVAALCGFSYIASLFGARFLLNGAAALAVAFCTTLATAVFFYLSARGRRRASKDKKTNGKRTAALLIALFLCAAAAFLCAALTPTSLHAAFAAASCALFLLWVFAATPVLFRLAANKLSAVRLTRADGRHPPRLCARYALKNTAQVKTLHNTCRLSTLLLSVSLAMLAVLSAGYRYADIYPNIFTADYLLLNAGQSTAAQVAALDSVQDVSGLYWNVTADENKNTVSVLSLTDSAVMAQKLRPAFLPEGTDAIFPRAYAQVCNLGVGDEWTLDIDGVACTFTVSALMDTPYNCIFFDCTQYGIAYSVLCVTGRDGVTASRLQADISACMALEMAAIVSVADFFEQQTSQFNVYLNCGNLLFICLILFSLTGLSDNLFESYRARKKEFALYASCGMTKRQITSLKAWETGVTLLCGILAGVLTSGALVLILHCWMESFSIDLLLLIAFSL